VKSKRAIRDDGLERACRVAYESRGDRRYRRLPARHLPASVALAVIDARHPQQKIGIPQLTSSRNARTRASKTPPTKLV
jgi:hypothetical protein